MKLTAPDIKIKVNKSNTKTLYDYLHELIINSDKYFETVTSEKLFKKIFLHHLKSTYEKVSKILFKHYHDAHDYKETLKITDAERHTLVVMFSFYPLPLDINFIDYELKQNLLK